MLNSSFIFSEVRIVDKITDLPVNYSKYLSNRRPPSIQSRTPSNASTYERPPAQFSQPEPAQQYRSTTYNYPGFFSNFLQIRIDHRIILI